MKKNTASIAISLFVVVLITAYKNPPQQKEIAVNDKKGSIKTGAEQTEKYLPYLKGKRVAILANQTSAPALALPRKPCSGPKTFTILTPSDCRLSTRCLLPMIEV